MNLYAIHPDPEMAPHRAWDYENVPVLVWERYRTEPEELGRREGALAKDAEIAYMYAMHVLCGPFPAGEPAVATCAWFAYMYARYVLRGPFLAGEPAIATDPGYAYRYARWVLKLPSGGAMAWGWSVPLPAKDGGERG